MKRSGKTRFIATSLLPAFLLYAVLILYPTFTVFQSSLFRRTAYTQGSGEFVGFSNFITLMQDSTFIKSFQNTIFLMVVVTVVTMFLAIFFAAILSRENVKGQNFFRIIFYIPNILSIAVVGAVFASIYGMDQGLINGLGRLFSDGWDNIPFLGDRVLVNYSIAGAMIWQAVGYYMVMYMSTMAQIPQHLYEAANLDGASKLKQFFDITLPLSWETVRTTLTFYVISNINIAFQIVKVLTDGKPNGASYTMLNYQYKVAYTDLTFGYGLAVGVIVFLFSFILSAIISKITDRDIIQF